MSSAAANGPGNSTGGQTYDHMFKLVMIGEAGVGKSSILLRFTDDRFDEDHLSTIGVDLRVKFVDVNKKKIKMVIWDTAGTFYVIVKIRTRMRRKPIPETFDYAL